MQRLADRNLDIDHFNIEDLHEVDVVDPIVERNEEIKGIFQDLEGLRDIMLEFNIITAQQGEQLGAVAENVSSAKVNTEAGTQELAKAHEYKEGIYKRRQGFMRVVAIVGGGGLGAVGFLANPLVGIGTVLAGGSLGWFITRGKTVDTILRVVPGKPDYDPLDKTD